MGGTGGREGMRGALPPPTTPDLAAGSVDRLRTCKSVAVIISGECVDLCDSLTASVV